MQPITRARDPRAHFGREKGTRSRAKTLPSRFCPCFFLALMNLSETVIYRFFLVPSKQPPPPPSDDARCCNDRRSCKRASSRLRPVERRPAERVSLATTDLMSPLSRAATLSRLPQSSSRVVPRSRLSRDYSRLSTTGSTRARAALTLAFSTRLLSLSGDLSLETRSLSCPRKSSWHRKNVTSRCSSLISDTATVVKLSSDWEKKPIYIDMLELWVKGIYFC